MRNLGKTKLNSNNILLSDGKHRQSVKEVTENAKLLDELKAAKVFLSFSFIFQK